MSDILNSPADGSPKRSNIASAIESISGENQGPNADENGTQFIDGIEFVRTAQQSNIGDGILGILDETGGVINEIDPIALRALSLVVSGPAGAATDFIIEKAIDETLKRNKEFGEGVATLLNETGLKVTDALSSSTSETDRDEVIPPKFSGVLR